MADQLQLRGGTTNEHSTFTGALREVTVDTDKDTLIVHDAATAGGHPLLREDGSNSALSLGTAGTPSLKFTGDTNTGLYSPGADQVAISTGGTGRLFVDASGSVGVNNSSPSSSLSNSAKGIVIADPSVAAIRINRTGATASALQIESNNGISKLDVRTNTPLAFHTNQAERLRIDSSGRLLLGVSNNTSGARLQVEGLTAGDGVSIRRNQAGSAAATLTVSKSRGTANGSFTSVANGDTLGTVSFRGADGTGDIQAAAIFASVDGTPGTNDMPGRLVFSTTADGASTATERMRIDSSGRVGVGTTSPINALHINGAAGATSSRFRLSSTEGSGFTIRAESATETMLNVDSSENLLFGVGGGEVARLDSSGRVGIGTTSFYTADTKLQITDDTNAKLTLNNPGDRTYSLAVGTDAALAFKDESGGTEIMRLDSSGRVGIGITSPAAPLVLYNTAASMRFQNSNSGTGTSDGLFVGLGGSSSTAAYVYNYENNDLVFGTNSTERARIDSSGRLLVGTSSDLSSNARAVFAGKLSGNDGQIEIRRAAATPTAGTTIGSIKFSDGNAASGHYADILVAADADSTSGSDLPGRIVFQTTADGASAPTERMRIDSGGNVLIATTSINDLGTVSITYNPTAKRGITFRPTSDNNSPNPLRFLNSSGTAVGNVITDETSTAYNTSSDYRLKENVVDLDGAIDRVKQLAPKRFNFIVGAGRTVDGFLAHEAQAVVPEAVTGTHNEVDDEGNPVYQGIDQSKLVPLLTAALQEAIGRIETLEAEVAALKGA